MRSVIRCSASTSTQDGSSGCPPDEVPFYEPGLATLVQSGVASGRLSFGTSLRDAYQRSKADRTLSAPVVMIAVGTPSNDDGSADISGVVQVARDIGAVIDEYTVVASKSTVPVGTGDRIAQAIAGSGADPALFDVVSNPEFLKEGAAVDDFMRPSRIIVGADAPAAEKMMLELYRAIQHESRPSADDEPARGRAHQVRRQRAARDQDQLHQRSRQPV